MFFCCGAREDEPPSPDLESIPAFYCPICGGINGEHANDSCGGEWVPFPTEQEDMRAVSERNDHNLLPRQLYINDNHIDLNVFEHLPQPNVSNNNSNNNNNNYLPPAIIQTDIVLTQPIRDTPEPGNRALRFDPASGTFVPASPPPPINPPVLLPPINPPPLLPSSPPPFRAEAVGVLEEPSLPAAYAQPVSSSSLINLPAVSMLAQAPATLDDDIVIVSAVDVFDDIDHDRHHDVAGENFDNNDNDRGSTDHSNRNSTGGDASTDANLSLILEAQRRLEVEMEGRRASENMHSNNRNKVKLENDNKVNSNSSVDDNDSVGNEDENSILSFAPLVRFESADMPGRIKSSSLSSSSSSLASNSARSQGNQNQLLRELHLARQEKKGQETELDMKREREARELRQEQEMLAVEKEQKETERRKRQEEEAEEQRKRLAEEDGKAKKKREDREKQEKKAFEKLLKEEKKLEKERGRKRDVREIKAMVRLAKQRTPPLSPKQPPATRAITQGRTGSRALKKKRSANSKVKRQAKVKVERLKTMERRKKERKELKSQSSFVALKIEHQDTVDTFVVNGMVKPVDRELEIERERLIRLSDKDGNIPCMPCLGTGNVMLDQSSDGGGGSGDGGYLACWFCSGSGVTSVWTNSIVAPSLDDLLNAEEASDDDDNDDMYDCQICYDSSMFGLSTTCQHFYCVECIRRSLDSMMDAGEFPAYCPACKAEAATGQNGALEARQGRIETRALSFLVHKRVLTREQYFRFKKMQARASNGDEFFPCPKKCGQYLIKQPLELGEKVVKFGDGYRREEKLGKCPCCDCRICMKCLREPNFETRVYDVQVADGKLLEHGQRIQAYREEDKEYHWAQVMWSADDEDTVLIEWLDGSAVDCQKETKHIRTARIATEHICPMDMRKDVELDEETEKLLANGTYKKCPNCGIYIQKNDGCNFMMCGAYAHGKISDAIKNGGCGHIFYWDSLLPAHTHHENDVQVTP